MGVLRRLCIIILLCGKFYCTHEISGMHYLTHCSYWLLFKTLLSTQNNIRMAKKTLQMKKSTISKGKLHVMPLC